MRVKAKKVGDHKYVGYYNHVRRSPGDIFDIADDSHFSEAWMEKCNPRVPKTPAPGEPDFVEEEPRKSLGRPKKDN